MIDQSGYCCLVGQSCGDGTGAHYALQGTFCVCVQNTDAGDAGDAGDGGCNPGTCWIEGNYNVCDLNTDAGRCLETDCVDPLVPCVGQNTSDGLGCCGIDAGTDGGDAGDCLPGACWSDPPYNTCDMNDNTGHCYEVNCVDPSYPCADPGTSTGINCCSPPDAGDAGDCTPGACWSDPPYNTCDVIDPTTGICMELNCHDPLMPCSDPSSDIGVGCCGGTDAGSCTPGTCKSTADGTSCTLVDSDGECESVDCVDPAEPCYDKTSPTGLSCCYAPGGPSDHLRALFTNVGNVAFGPSCFLAEEKLCSPEVSANISAYIAHWQPDVIMISEVAMPKQMTHVIKGSDLWPLSHKLPGVNFGGPILPQNVPGLTYDYRCHDNHKKGSGFNPGIWDSQSAKNGIDGDWSHSHECVAWRTDVFKLARPGDPSLSEDFVFGQDQDPVCHHDFTIEMVDLESVKHAGFILTAVAVHPQSDLHPLNISGDVACRMNEIETAFVKLAGKAHVLMGGDFNTESLTEIDLPAAYAWDFSKGDHFGGSLGHHPGEHSAGHYNKVPGWASFDHVFHGGSNSSWAWGCTNCGSFYRTKDLPYGSALGLKDAKFGNTPMDQGHPNICGGTGCDHAQVLVDYTYSY